MLWTLLKAQSTHLPYLEAIRAPAGSQPWALDHARPPPGCEPKAASIFGQMCERMNEGVNAPKPQEPVAFLSLDGTRGLLRCQGSCQEDGVRLQEGSFRTEKPLISCLHAFLHLGQRQRENRGRQVQVAGLRPGCVLGWEVTPETLSERGPSHPHRGLSPPTRTPPTSQKYWGQSFRRVGSVAATAYLDPSRTSWLSPGQRAVGTME